ncbi:hypothetical protein O181_045952 [Austropuccinia psidii MF-1]|uniref:Uncharacterized protein n=1 Tax=Austropuccinia psidii MF-1 TaxID=1389203 RepID=A0A9Q3DUV8_9BASI|nr:hypothetical protein [Austropuccinia psidii MF-1]
MPCKQTPQQHTPGPSGTQWFEDLSHEPSQHNEPPIPGPSPSSEPPEDILTSHPATPCSVIIIHNMPVGSPLHSYPGSFPGSSSHCHQEPNRLLPSFPRWALEEIH